MMVLTVRLRRTLSRPWTSIDIIPGIPSPVLADLPHYGETPASRPRRNRRLPRVT